MCFFGENTYITKKLSMYYNYVNLIDLFHILNKIYVYNILGCNRRKAFVRIISGQNRGTKLNTLEGEETRPTLDRVKESLFNIIQVKLEEESIVVLDLFAGSGALGLESLSRGASKAIFCDKFGKAIDVINKNIDKTRNYEKAVVLKCSYENALDKLKLENISLDIIFLDPPYESNYYQKALEKIKEYNLLKEDGIIILETDDKDRIIKIIDSKYFDIYDVRKYGRVSLIFLNRKG